MNNTYKLLSKVGFLSRHYTGKFLFIAFLGIHVPLIAIVAFIFSGTITLSPLSVTILALVATLLATGITLYILNGLLYPLHLGKRALDSYLVKNEQPMLPTHYQDEAGQLLSRLQETMEKLDALMEEKKDLIALFSHDMRTPVSQMVTLSRLVQEEKDPNKLKEHTAIIQQVAERQLNFLGDMLTMLKADYFYKSEKEFELFPLKEWLEDCVRYVQPAAKQKNVNIVLSIKPIGCNLLGEKAMLNEAFCNVLGNAIKFSYPNSQIVVQASPAKDRCRLEVIDHGMGFQNSISRKLFEKFTKHGRSGTAGEHSTGMGLYLTKTILHKHNGSIEAFSNGTDKGATFTIELPCK